MKDPKVFSLSISLSSFYKKTRSYKLIKVQIHIEKLLYQSGVSTIFLVALADNYRVLISF